ncbi:hypothetical protein [Aeoliella mucimassa]|uniref:Uncharacterized protein n=1 Tax=Aeoliella mucimassa TaxID=2527972 RepID=A0A518AL50_9BACT|nr:hypothetical protein [Aeoliella mucimassa]QDU55416.1 hypothetical protein Pan181_16050 [Aeoliella mucimassa]
MGMFKAAWEDEENNRRVDLVVAYQVADGQVEIDNVTPHRVHFRDPESGETTRSIRVHTESGKQLLLDRALSAGAVDRIRHQLSDADVHEVRHDLDMVHDPHTEPSLTV